MNHKNASHELGRLEYTDHSPVLATGNVSKLYPQLFNSTKFFNQLYCWINSLTRFRKSSSNSFNGDRRKVKWKGKGFDLYLLEYGRFNYATNKQSYTKDYIIDLVIYVQTQYIYLLFPPVK